ncbi:hypothetical protein SADUNF_Sadunf06G0000100 [Salix dunnii]|uniref:Uncharacterized protein n=1 Tax=Salix dunnii TaxID=1413687 RepID=A0A835MVW8_9ROSI|nr:hypothetical protein SADUNF_Sadunf06G0000100 [Salix dunnii]
MDVVKTRSENNQTQKPQMSTWVDRVKVTEARTRFTLDPIPRSVKEGKLEIIADMLSDQSRKRLSVVASKVGRPLSCDEPTFCCTRLDYAQVFRIWGWGLGFRGGYNSRKRLSVVASKVGRPLSCDEPTFCCTRLDYARVFRIWGWGLGFRGGYNVCF